MSDLLIKKIGEFQTEFESKLDKNGQETSDAKKMAEKATAEITNLMAKHQEFEQKAALASQSLEKQLASMETILTASGNVAKGEKASAIDPEFRASILAYIKDDKNIPDQALAQKVASEIAGKMFGYAATSTEAALKAKAMLEGIGSSGGYFVTPERIGAKVTQDFETSPFRAYASVMNIAGNEIEVIIDDNEAAAPAVVTEITPRNTKSATPKIGLLKIVAGELSETVEVTQRILDDYPNIDSWLMDKLNDKFYRTEATNLVSGNGVDCHNGLLSKAAWTTPGVYERNKIEQINSGISGGFNGDFFISLQNSLHEKFQGDAAWYMKRQTFGEVLKLKDGNGNYLINLQNMLLLGADKTLLGAPVRFAADMQTIAADSLSVLYGDIKKSYMIIDRLGMRILRDPYTNKPFIGYTAYKRSGGDYISYEGVKIGKLAV